MTTISKHIRVKTTKGWKTLYWASTILVALALAAIGAADLIGVPKVVEGLLRLGYPAYFAIILGVWKMLGSTAIILPGFPHLKEWAYAGMFFTLSGAAISHAVAGDSLGEILVPLVLLVAVITSWMLQPARDSGYRGVAKTQRDALWLFVDDTGGVDGTTGMICTIHQELST